MSELTGRSPLPHRRQKVADSVARQIVRDIRARGLEPGDRLAPEHEMLAHMNVARGTLREGLRYLEFQGVLTIRPGPNGGPIVTAPNASHLARTLGLVLQFSGATYGHLLQARLALEPHIAGLAAQHAEPATLKALRASVEGMREHLQDRATFFEENARFHEVIASSSRNPFFKQLLEALHGVTDGANLGAEYPVERRRRVADAHERICEGLEAREREVAEAAMYDHVAATIRYTKRYHPALFNMQVNWDHFGT